MILAFAIAMTIIPALAVAGIATALVTENN